MQFIISAATLLLAASSAIASPAVRRQAEELDDNVRVILRDDVGGEVITTFQSVPSRISGGVASDIQFTTVEIDVGTDADPALRCEVTTDDNVPIVANRGENKDVVSSLSLPS